MAAATPAGKLPGAQTLCGFGETTGFPSLGYETYVEESFLPLTVEDDLKWPLKSMDEEDSETSVSGGCPLPLVGRGRPTSLCCLHRH